MKILEKLKYQRPATLQLERIIERLNVTESDDFYFSRNKATRDLINGLHATSDDSEVKALIEKMNLDTKTAVSNFINRGIKRMAVGALLFSFGILVLSAMVPPYIPLSICIAGLICIGLHSLSQPRENCARLFVFLNHSMGIKRDSPECARFPSGSF